MDEIFRSYLISEFAEDYEEGHLSRRQALRLIAGVTGSLLLANSVLAGCSAPPKETAVIDAVPPTLLTRAPGSTAPAAGSPIPAADTPEGPGAATTEAPLSTIAPTTLDASQPTASVETLRTPPAYGTVAADDSAVHAETVEFPGEDGAAVTGYLAYPAQTAAGGDAGLPIILVCHENRGLTPHIQDVARRLAKAGYAALAVDLLSRSGGTQALNADDVPGILGNTQSTQFVADFKSGWRWLGNYTPPQGQKVSVERVGMVGFCFGGGVTWLVATKMPELKAATPFYGPLPPLEDVPNIRAAVRAVYAGEDTRINQGIPGMEEAMRQNGKTFEKIIYPNTQHAFFNDTGPRYAPDAARDAWAKTLEWFGKYV